LDNTVGNAITCALVTNDITVKTFNTDLSLDGINSMIEHRIEELINGPVFKRALMDTTWTSCGYSSPSTWPSSSPTVRFTKFSFPFIDDVEYNTTTACIANMLAIDVSTEVPSLICADNSSPCAYSDIIVETIIQENPLCPVVGMACALATYTVSVSCSDVLNEKDVRKVFQDAITEFTNSKNYADLLLARASCPYASPPTISTFPSLQSSNEPSLRPSTWPSSSPTLPFTRVSFPFVDDVEYNTTCIEHVLPIEVSKAVATLTCTDNSSPCAYFDVEVETIIQVNPLCPFAGMSCVLATYIVSVSYPDTLKKKDVRKVIQDGITTLTNSKEYEDAIFGRNDVNKCGSVIRRLRRRL